LPEMSWKPGFDDLVKKTHTQQAIWWLNGFWKKGAEAERETVYQYAQTFKELEYGGKIIEKKGKAKETEVEYKEGHDLDEFKAHRFLETVGEVLTVVALRKKLETIDLDKNKRMAISEYLLFKYSKTAQELVESPQGDNQAEVEKAQAEVAGVQKGLADVQQKIEEQRIALEQQKIEEAAAKEQEKKLEAAKVELEAAVADLKKQEEDLKNKITTLKAKTEDASLSTVQKSKASNELAQLQGEDPLPIRKAKITQEAAVRKVEKEVKLAKVATEKAEKARLGAEEQARQLEKAEEELKVKFEAAQTLLEEVKKKGGTPLGAIWWMEKELAEARKLNPSGRKFG